MITASLALALALGLGAEADSADLVRQLGAARAAEREAAASALERLGREALPVLRVATDSRNPLVRDRAAALIRTIEGTSLVDPTRITLDFEERPLSEVVEAIAAQAHLRLALEPEDDGAWRRRPITLIAPGPVPFWEAIDRLCAAGRLYFDLRSPASLSEPGDSRPAVRLTADTGRGLTGPTSYSGPFRVTLTRLHYEQSVGFVRDPAARPDAASRARGTGVVDEQFSVAVQVLAEPRMILIASPPRLLEATDDRGQSLLPAGPGRRFPVLGTIGIYSIESPIDLGRPRAPGETIRTLRGSFSILLASRRPDPLTIPLAGAEGRSFTIDGTTLVIQRLDPSWRRPLELTARPAPGDPAAGPEDTRSAGGERRLDLLAHQIELIDAAGRTIPTLHGGQSGDEVRLSIRPSVDIGAGVGPPDRIRVYAMTRAPVEVPFEFTNLPMP